MEPSKVYNRRNLAYMKRHERLQGSAYRLSNYRFYTVLIGLAVLVFLYRMGRTAMAYGALAVTLLLFTYWAIRHQRIRTRLRYVEAIRDLNRKGAQRVAGEWAAFADTGAEFKDDEHPYASDLDLFGQASLFQWINATTTLLGRQSLAEMLRQPAKEQAEVLARQEAVTELARKLSWRQRFEAEGLLVRDRLQTPEPLLQWAGEMHGTYLQPLTKLGVRALPLVTIAVVMLYFVSGAVPWQVPAAFVVLQGLLLRLNGKERSQVLTMVYRHEAQLRTYAHMLRRFETHRFGAPWLSERQERLRDGAGTLAFQQTQRLSQIAERISNRQNAMFIILNLLTLWDYQCMIALAEWKRESGKRLRTWLETLAEVEALSSLANIRFDHPGWAMPALVQEHGLSARSLGHPLIARNRVANDFELRAPAQISVLTGSNMSGKSTFLRTIGVNLVLAYAGAPVCAAEFSCSRMQLWTSMRVADNLEQSISSFYAEILRIKRIVDAAKSTGNVCFLIDEVFKGTNSYDRHQGAKALIAQLQRYGAFGLISTHDLELGALEDDSRGRVKNYHFREHYQDGEIRFDYKLRPGVSTTRNALYLMKLIGVELEQGD